MDLVQIVAYPVLLVVQIFGVVSPIFLIGILLIPFVLGYQIDGTKLYRWASSLVWVLPWLIVGLYWYFRDSKGFSALIEGSAIISLSVLGSLVSRRLHIKHEMNYHFYVVALVSATCLYLSYNASFLGK